MNELDTTSLLRNHDPGVVYETVDISQLHGFRGHPFKVEQNIELFELMRSIEKEGVLTPLLVRKNPYGDGYEIIAGHRRKAACKWAGVRKVPVKIVEFDDEESIIAMVDSNLHREDIKPSEKAFALKMKLDAMRRQGQRTDLTLCQDGKKIKDNPTVQVAKLECGYDTDGNCEIRNLPVEKYDANQQLAMQIGESKRQVARYIRLTYLIPKLLDMVDGGDIAFTVAVELSYLTEEEQYELHAVMDLEQCTPSLSQASRMKRLSQQEKLDMDVIYSIMEEMKPNQIEHIKIKADLLNEYFPHDFTEKQKIDLIEKLVKEWHEKESTAKTIKRPSRG